MYVYIYICMYICIYVYLYYIHAKVLSVTHGSAACAVTLMPYIQSARTSSMRHGAREREIENKRQRGREGESKRGRERERERVKESCA